jgi:hypothetical protein
MSLQWQRLETSVENPRGLHADELHIGRMAGYQLSQLPARTAAGVDDGAVCVPDRDQAERIVGDAPPAGIEVGWIVVGVGER